MPKLKPTGLKPAYWRECLDVLSAEPTLIRWRTRPRSHFAAGVKGDLAFRVWGKTSAGQTIRPTADGRLRLSLSINGRDDRQKFDARAIIAEIGVTPPDERERFGPHGGLGPDGPNDRLAAMREVAGSGPLAAVVQEAMDETGRSLTDLTVMDVDKDPYRIDTPAKHRDAQWAAALVARFIADPNRSTHPRVHLLRLRQRRSAGHQAERRDLCEHGEGRERP